MDRLMRRGIRAAVAAATLTAVSIPAAAEAQSSLLPWPNDALTVRDEGTETGRRLNLPRDGMPRNKDGVPIDPTDMNRADGFSPGSTLIIKVPGLDNEEARRRSRLPSLADLARSLRKRSPVVVINARTGKRHPVWAELDSNATTDQNRMLVIRPARNFSEGERYVAVLRNLRTAGGEPIGRKNGFRAALRRSRGGPSGFRRRGGFRALRKADVSRRGVYLAWDFTVASMRSLAGRMLHVRNAAFRGLGDPNLSDLEVAGDAPRFTIDSVTDPTLAEDDRIARRVDGTVTVPCYLTNGCAPGGHFTLNRRGLPERQGTATAAFTCRIPRSALDPADPRAARPALYGHGLLGRTSEVDAENVRSMANEHNFVFCATAWAGFSGEDLPNVVSALSDFSRFNTIADRMQQGFLNQLMLGRLMVHAQGLSSHPAFQKNGRSVIDTRRLFFDGNSQGGILGGGLTAVAPDFERAVLGVTGMNFSTLLERSIGFDAYAQLIYPAYPDESTRQLVFALVQLLWDRGEANGYAQHMTDRPLPGTPRHTVLLHVGFGDHLVSDTTAEVEARTIGARGYRPVLEPGRSPWTRFQLIRPIVRLPFKGSAIVMWDSGTPAPPITNTPNRAGDDPHDNVRATPAARVQKSEFLKLEGRVVDVCDGRPCHAVP
jgi:hypothetical protein